MITIEEVNRLWVAERVRQTLCGETIAGQMHFELVSAEPMMRSDWTPVDGELCMRLIDRCDKAFYSFRVTSVESAQEIIETLEARTGHPKRRR